MSQSHDMVVISEEVVRTEAPDASVSCEEPLPTLADAPLVGICSMEVENSEAPTSSAQDDEVFARTEKKRTSERFFTLSEVMEGLGNVSSMEFEASLAPITSTGATHFALREERTRTSEGHVNLSNETGEFFEGLENFCLLEGRSGVHSRRSPLPVWYPRRPLQDITAALNIGPVPSEEASNFKKGSKKAPIVKLPGHLQDNRRVFGQQRAPRVQFKPTSSLSAASKRSSLLRKGFR